MELYFEGKKNAQLPIGQAAMRENRLAWLARALAEAVQATVRRFPPPLSPACSASALSLSLRNLNSIFALPGAGRSLQRLADATRELRAPRASRCRTWIVGAGRGCRAVKAGLTPLIVHRSTIGELEEDRCAGEPDKTDREQHDMFPGCCRRSSRAALYRACTAGQCVTPRDPWPWAPAPRRPGRYRHR